MILNSISDPKFLLETNFFWSNIFFGPKFFKRPTIYLLLFFGPKIIFEANKFVGPQFFLTQHFLRHSIFLGQKIFRNTNSFFEPQIFLGPTIILPKLNTFDLCLVEIFDDFGQFWTKFNNFQKILRGRV